MDFRKKNEFKEKMKLLYDGLYFPNKSPSKNSNFKSKISKKERNEKFRYLNKLLLSPSRIEKPKKTILSLIEETKRDYLNYKTFLNIETGKKNFENNNKFKNLSNLSRVNKEISFRFNNNVYYPFDFINEKKSIENRNDNLKKEIFEKINMKWSNSNSNISTINKTNRDFESSIVS